MSARVSVEGARGCGFRKPGGYYLVAPSLSEPCPRLPLPLTVCPTCSCGIKPARGWTWITPEPLFPAEVHGSPEHNRGCPLGAPEPHQYAEPGHRCGERAGLIWIGEAFYATPEEFTDEAARMGVSRRIKAVPQGFEVGETWVFLAHRKAIRRITDLKFTEVSLLRNGDLGIGGTVVEDEFAPGVITLFRPTAVEYIVKPEEEEDEELHERLRKRGIEPVKVIREGEPVGALL